MKVKNIRHNMIQNSKIKSLFCCKKKDFFLLNGYNLISFAVFFF